ncbi:hypothetical protein R3P38DRAFT_3187078 [Favolaschia claudopus]|uniref:Uncharacterized protein n=1 Tax=Favolaschia claudopus TaxID=2862362 RepID=A0AAW0BWT2_9AGAR
MHVSFLPSSCPRCHPAIAPSHLYGWNIPYAYPPPAKNSKKPAVPEHSSARIRTRAKFTTLLHVKAQRRSRPQLVGFLLPFPALHKSIDIDSNFN